MSELVHLHLPADRAALDAAVQRAEMAAMAELVHNWHDKDSLLAQGDSDSATARLSELQTQLLLTFQELYAGLLAANQQQSPQPCSDALKRCSKMLAAAAGLPEAELERQWLDCWQGFDSDCLGPAQVCGYERSPLPPQRPCHAGLLGTRRARRRGRRDCWRCRAASPAGQQASAACRISPTSRAHPCRAHPPPPPTPRRMPPSSSWLTSSLTSPA
jgi:hypothetical protein